MAYTQAFPRLTQIRHFGPRSHRQQRSFRLRMSTLGSLRGYFTKRTSPIGALTLKQVRPHYKQMRKDILVRPTVRQRLTPVSSLRRARYDSPMDRAIPANRSAMRSSSAQMDSPIG